MPDTAPEENARGVAPGRAKPGLYRAEEAAGWCFVLPAMPVLAFGYLLVHEDPRNWETANSYHGTSDIVTFAESGLSLGTAAVVVAVSVVWIVRDP